MLKKIIIAVIVIAVVSLGSAGYIYAYQKEAAKQNPEREGFSSDGMEYGFGSRCNHNKDCQSDCEGLEYEYKHEWSHNYQYQVKDDCEGERYLNGYEYKYSHDYKNDGAEYFGHRHSYQNDDEECLSYKQDRRNSRSK